jgi:hypothetical protein
MIHALSRSVACAVVALSLALGVIAPASAGGVTRVTDAERYAQRLLNCTRTGGFVAADGRCLAWGSGTYSAYRRPLRLHPGISTKVAWPWARAMVVYGICDHVIPGKPTLSQRLRRKGFRNSYYGENVGCAWGSGDARAVVLATHRMMQAEQQTRGGHWRNIKDARFKSVGIGVAKGNGRVMVVWDFYGKRF